jgi:carbohydrate esterase-like sialic acid-specific acetylesterase
MGSVSQPPDRRPRRRPDDSKEGDPFMFTSRRWSASSLLLGCCLACGSGSDDPDAMEPGNGQGGLPADGAGGDPSGLGGSSGQAAGATGGGTTGPGEMPAANGGTPLDPSGAGGSAAGDGQAAGASGDMPASTGVDPNFFIFLLFGQSNMEGVPQPEAEDRVENPRVKVMAYDNCAGLGRVYNEWYTASPPLHSCGLGVGPGDYFGKALADAFPDATIGLVPNAIAGVDIDFFRKGVTSARRGEFRIPPDNQRSTAYDMIIERARLAQEVGVIKGILFHQGESDSGEPNRGQWVGKLQEIVADLKADLGLGDVPFLAGELLYNASGGCCGNSLNPLIATLPTAIPNAFAISADGLANIDAFHFDLPGQREFGRRYGQTMIDALSP